MADTVDRATESALFADIGTLWTNLFLIDQVEGVYRYLACGSAPTEIEPATADVSTAIEQAAGQIEKITGRLLLERRNSHTATLISPEIEDGAGVDLFVAAASAAAPPSVALFSPSWEEVTLLQSAVQQFKSREVGAFSADAPAGRWHPAGMVGAIEKLIVDRPDLIVIGVGDVPADDPVVEEMLDGLNTLNHLIEVDDRPRILLVGGEQSIDTPRTRLQETNTVTPITVADDSSPAQVRAAVCSALERFYHNNWLAHLPGFGTLQAWSPHPITAVESAQRQALRVIHEETEQDILFVHIGNESSHLIAAGSDAFYSRVRPDIGTGTVLGSFIERAGTEAIFRWVPGVTPERDLAALLTQRTLRPRTLPATRESLWLEQAITRTALSQLLSDEAGRVPSRFQNADAHPAVNYIIASGTPFRTAPEPAQAALMLLDALQPVGIIHLVRDRLGLLPAMGLLAEQEPMLVNDLFSTGGLESLGTVIVPTGEAKPGASILRFPMALPDAGLYDVTVKAGDIYREYLPPGATLELELTPARGIDVGLGPGTSTRVTVSGGTAGLLIDARGRPLPQREDLVEQRRQVQEWIRYVGG